MEKFLNLAMDPAQWMVLVKLLVAFFLGGIIGWEREIHDKPAGLRTHMLVAGASALLMEVNYIVAAYQGNIPGAADPVRTVQAIVTGITFLGAGTIIRGQSQKVEGLTTAATILMASVVGIYVGLSQHVAALGIAVFTVITLRLASYNHRHRHHDSAE